MHHQCGSNHRRLKAYRHLLQIDKSNLIPRWWTLKSRSLLFQNNLNRMKHHSSKSYHNQRLPTKLKRKIHRSNRQLIHQNSAFLLLTEFASKFQWNKIRTKLFFSRIMTLANSHRKTLEKRQSSLTLVTTASCNYKLNKKHKGKKGLP